MDSPQQQRQDVSLAGRIWLLIEAWAVPPAPIAAYLIGLAAGLRGIEVNWVLLWVVPGVILIDGSLYPYLMTRFLTTRAFHAPEHRVGHRQERLLKLPWRIVTYAVMPAWGV